MSSRSHQHRRPNGPAHSTHASGAAQPRAAARRLGPLRLSAAVVTWLAALAVLCVVGALSPVVADDGTGDGTGDPATTAATSATDPGTTDPTVTDPSAAPDPAADPPATTSDPSGPTAPSDTSGSGAAGTGSTGTTQKPSTSRLAALADPACTSGTVVGSFEIDGNTPPCTDDDWDTPKGNHVVDPTGGADTSNFTSGSKEFANPASWSTGTGTAPNKDDVKDVYLYNTTVGGDIYSYFGFSRVAVNGTTSYDIEYNQKPNLTANPPRPNRTPGDLLVQVEQHGNKAFEFVLDGAFLWTLKSDPNWSTSCIEVPSLPSQPDAGWCQKNVPAGAFTGATSDDGFFAEGALDISTLYGDGTCIGDFGRINIRSWASNAGTAELKDWVEPQPVNIQGTCADIFIEKVDSADPTKHIGGATYEITPDPTPGSSAVKLTVTDNGANDLDPADGYIKVSPVEPGSYAVKETVAPTGYFLPSPQTQGPQAVPKSGSFTFVFKDKRQWKAPTISKDAAGSYDASYDWSIAKTVGNPGEQKPDDKAAQNVPEGTSATFDYGVTVTEGAEHKTNYRVTGKVSVGNANADAMRVTLSDTLSDNTGCTFPGATDVDAAAGLQVDVPAGGKDYAYTCSPGANPSAGTNTASVSWDTSKYPQTQAQADSGSGTDSRSASAAYGYTPTTVTNKTVHVVDDKTVAGASNALGTITWSAQGTEHPFTYSLTFPGTAGQCTDYTNKATIVETAQDASATATVCVGRNLTVTKNKVASLTRTYHYSIAKAADDTTLDADPTTGKATAHYTVTVTDGAATDSDWVMTGSIEVTNPNAWESISLTGISDTYSGDQAQSCTVDQAPGLTIGAGAKKTYSYSCLFASQPAYNGTNVATVTWDKAQAATPKGDASGSAAVVEADWALSKVDATVHVVDDKTVPGQSHDLGTVTWTAKGTQHTFGYDLDLQGVPGQCKAYPNIATISETQDSATETVTVCAPQAITVSKTATGTYDRTYLWKIEKQVDKTRVDIDGGTARFNYTVAATPNGYQDSGWTMGGSITVSNPNAFKSVTAHVTDVPSAGPGASCTVANGGDVTVPAGHVVNGAVVPGTASLAYSCTVPNEPIYAASTNTAYATWDGGSADTGAVPVGFTLAKETNKTVDVTDDKTTPIPQALGTATWNAASTPTTFGYHLDLPGVDGQCTTYDNTAAITQTGQDSSQSVQVCQQKALVVAKTVHAGYDRTYLWTIAKAADKTSVEISSGGTATFHYTVTVTPDGVTDSGYVMSGSISVTNPNSAAVGSITADVVDVPSVGDGITCAVTGGSGVAIAAGATAQLPYTCTFGGHVPSSSGTNTATASWQGNQGGRSASDTEDVDFTLKGETNKTIDVVDDKTVAGQSIALGTASWDDGAKSFGYDLDLPGVAGTCTPYTNTATISQTQQDATQTVTVCVEAPLDVSKSVDASFHRTYLWDLAKNADQTRVEVTDADSALFHYTVTATPGSYVDSGYDLHGTITVHNPNSYEGGSITANVSDLPHVGAGITCAVPGGSGATVAPGQTRTFDYTCSFGAATPQYTGGTNEAKVDWTGPGDVARTGSDVKDVTFGIGGTTDKTVTVTDDKTDPQHPVVLGTATWNADGTPTVFAYDLELTGQVGKCLPFTNTAVLDLEHAEDIVKQATVTLCVQANAVLANVVNASYDRSYAWSIDKAADQTHVDVGSNGKATVNYTVNVTPGAATDSGWEMSGSLTVGNPNEYKSLTVTVANTTDLGAGVTCPLDPGQDMTVPAGGSTTYTYTCAITDQPAYTGTDTATVTWDKGSVSLDTPIAFALDQETNRTVTVVDDKTVPGESHTLGTAEWNEAGTPVPFTYSLALGAAANKCQDYTNTATIVETEQSDDATVTVCGPSVKPDEAGRPRPGTPAAVEGVESSLPNTGGPHGVYVWSGAALVLAGCGLLLWSRRRRSES